MIIDEQECRALLSQNIKRFRAKLGLSQLDLALQLNISPTFLSDIEKGKKWLSPNTLVRLAGALNIEVYELFKPEMEMSPQDIGGILEHCIDDMSHSFRQSFEKSIQESIKNIKNHYLGK
jgi:transcriptional regulator with XRE-family HTH domain